MQGQPNNEDMLRPALMLAALLERLEEENAALKAQIERAAGRPGSFFLCEKLEGENTKLRADKDRLITILQHLVNTAKRAMKEANRDGAEWDIKDELSDAYAAIDAARKEQP